jgi:hypothetical protein
MWENLADRQEDVNNRCQKPPRSYSTTAPLSRARWTPSPRSGWASRKSGENHRQRGATMASPIPRSSLTRPRWLSPTRPPSKPPKPGGSTRPLGRPVGGRRRVCRWRRRRTGEAPAPAFGPRGTPAGGAAGSRSTAAAGDVGQPVGRGIIPGELVGLPPDSSGPAGAPGDRRRGCSCPRAGRKADARPEVVDHRRVRLGDDAPPDARGGVERSPARGATAMMDRHGSRTPTRRSVRRRGECPGHDPWCGLQRDRAEPAVVEPIHERQGRRGPGWKPSIDRRASIDHLTCIGDSRERQGSSADRGGAKRNPRRVETPRVASGREWAEAGSNRRHQDFQYET